MQRDGKSCFLFFPGINSSGSSEKNFTLRKIGTSALHTFYRKIIFFIRITDEQWITNQINYIVHRYMYVQQCNGVYIQKLVYICKKYMLD